MLASPSDSNGRKLSRSSLAFPIGVLCSLHYFHLMTGSNQVFPKSLEAVLEQRLGHQAFDTWFRPLTLVKSPKEHVLTICAPNLVVKDWIMANYGTVLQESL